MALPPDDSTLHAFLDSELDAVAHAEVEGWLRAHPEDAARVRLWAADREALRQRLAAELHEPVPERLVATVWQNGRRRDTPFWRRPMALAAGLLLFVLGAVVGWMGNGEAELRRAGPALASAPAAVPQPPWPQRAVLAHSVYVPEQRHPVEVGVAGASPAEQRAQEEHLARWLTKRLARPVRLFDLQRLGWSLVGGRLLPDAPMPGAQLMYQATDGRRITVYLRQPETGTPAEFRFLQDGSLGVFYWVDGSIGQETGYAVTGALPRPALLSIAEEIHRQTGLPVAAAPPASAAPARPQGKGS